MNKNNPFSLYEVKPTTVRYGKVYVTKVKIDVPFEKKRMVRLYIPEDYQPSKRYSVLYMSDGQNLVDKYTSAFGDWKLDLRMHELIKKGYPSFIIVGIDCPKNPTHRILEYSFPKIGFNTSVLKSINSTVNSESYGDKFLTFLVNIIKPMVDSYFSTSEISAIGGSSMGGLFALNGYITYPDVFSFCLSFSPAFQIYPRKQLINYLEQNSSHINMKGKIFFYTGAMGFEKQFFSPTISMHRYFQKIGYDPSRLALIVDTRMPHHEDAWSHYFNDAIQFWLDKPNNKGKI
jgi:predicted alpha/beta superfamily hydrolase